jgi:hypothetical protein
MRSLVWRMVVAGALGFLAVPLYFVVAHLLQSGHSALGLTPTFVMMALYFFACQFFLSRGHPGALFEDWPIMLALDLVWIFVLVSMALLEPLEVILNQGIGMFISCFGGTLAGAFAASRRARPKVRLS